MAVPSGGALRVVGLTGPARQRAALYLKCGLLSRLRARGERTWPFVVTPLVAGAEPRHRAARRALRHTGGSRGGSRLLGRYRTLADPHIEVVSVDCCAVHRCNRELCRALGRDVDKPVAQ